MSNIPLFDTDEFERSAEEWQDMPEFINEDLEPEQQIIVSFRNQDDVKEFGKLIGQKLTYKTKSVWWPENEIMPDADKAYVLEDNKVINPKYPVYIISKGRWESRLTSKALERMGVPYKIVIEPQEFPMYSKVINPDKILLLPFSNLGQGSIPARNWVWEHALEAGHERHWILDDNIRKFVRFNRNGKVEVLSGVIFRAAEDFTDRYENVALSGLQYWMFVPKKVKCSAYVLNTRIYSCILIKNDLPYRWRGRYNEDTDLSIRALKDGWCTILFYSMLCEKMSTMQMKGGNTDELYKQNDEMDGRLLMAQSLVEQHPDIVSVTEKWGRYQHHVDYRSFRFNKLIKKPTLFSAKGVNNMGMVLKKVDKKRLFQEQEQKEEIKLINNSINNMIKEIKETSPQVADDNKIEETFAGRRAREVRERTIEDGEENIY